MNENTITEASAKIASDFEVTPIDIDFDCYYEDKEPAEEHCCTGCMDCLGLSWADFL